MLLEEKVSLEDVLKFIKRVPPFQFLDDETLSAIADSLSVESYQKGTYIMKQGEPASEYLYI
ncbi:MAG: cyclic nucleotide-binding domain-containing protein, partial [Dissulfurispiraceae bacterium]